MSLKEYAKKRTFGKTPEPPPGKSPVASGSRFFIQRHHASRLHYDFRLEVDGVLASWAVPKGPTLDPSVKQLAMKVEDHPLDYGNFEGNIPKGNYGAGSVMVWDRGTYDVLGDKSANEELREGNFKIRLHGQKLRGEFVLVRMKRAGKGNEWLLIKKKDGEAQPGWDVEEHARSVATGRAQEEIARDVPASPVGKAAPFKPPRGAVKAPMPKSAVPMHGILVDGLPEGPDWRYEVKWDGVRALCFLQDRNVRLISRSGRAIDRQYPEISAAHENFAAESAIVDGEIVALDDEGRPRFELLQPRISVTGTSSIASLARKRPVTFFAFDLLYLNGYDLRNCSYGDRRKVLQSVLKPGPLARYSDEFADGRALLEAVRHHGLEGVMAKRVASPYQQRRSQDWRKIKVISQQEAVICGYTTERREKFSALVLGVYEGDRLVHIGNVGTGFDGKTIDLIDEKLHPLRISKPPFRKASTAGKKVTWVRPELVCSVRFLEWTADGKLRAPVFLGLRPDMDPRECVREQSKPADPPQEKGPLIHGQRDEESYTIEGRRLRFTNLGKIFYPREGFAKRDLLNYYDAVAQWIVPHLRDRPLSLKRYPNGIEGGFFFQKDIPKNFPSWVRTEPISERGKAPVRYAVAGDRATLLYLTQLGCIDQNPWMSRIGSLDNPDWVLIDLDPYECPYARIIEAALLVREKLEVLGLTGYPKTTGGKGMHIYIPVEPVYSYEQTRAFAEVLARVVIGERPKLFTTPRPVAEREKGKVYFDYLQNGKAKTIAAPYVLRAFPGAPVATPLDWNEVKPGLKPEQFQIRNALERFEGMGDLFDGVLTLPQRLERAIEKLAELIDGKRS